MQAAHRRDRRRRGAVTLTATLLAAASVLGAPVTRLTPSAPVRAAASFADTHFREFTAFSGLTRPVTVRFASDGRAFVAEKAGLVKAFDSVTDTTPTTVIDLSTEVNSYWDRGLLGLAIDPGFLTGRPYLYLYYVYDAPPGQTAPVWHDTCANPPGGTIDGCPVTARLERVEIEPSSNVAVPGSRTLLIGDWCQQFPSHAGGGLGFGSDGQLYLSGGDGANFNTTDYGQLGGTRPTAANPVTPVNPCGDPTTLLAPNPDGSPVTQVATAEGGTLRSQDVRTGGDPTGLDGTIIRIDPDTGLGSVGNPLTASSDQNERRIVAHGFRNAFRWTFRPGTVELYMGDVGNQTWEEIERVVPATTALTRTSLPNFGWPCYEGVARSGLQSLGLDMCASLYNQGAAAVAAPFYQYSHWSSLSPTGPCFSPGTNGGMGSSVTGLAFYQGAEAGSAPYPDRLKGALFFADYARNCLAVMLAGPGGVPDPTTVETVASGIGHPVDLVTGPGGDLYYVDIDGGRVVRVRHLLQPIARGTVTPAMSSAPVTVTLDASGSSDPDPTSTLTAWSWDLDHDGHFDGPNDLSGKVVDWAVATKGVYPITLQVVSSNGLTDAAELVVDTSNAPPVPSIDSPDPSLTWAVGDTIAFSGSAKDDEDGALPVSALSWDLVMMHCPAGCHEHVIQTSAGVGSGSFDAPDHEYPSHLALRLTATDSHGSSRTTGIDLQPKTAAVAVDSSPAGVPLFVAGVERASPSEVTVIRNGAVTVSAPLTPMIGGKRQRFAAWSDGRPRTHLVTAASPVVNLVATFVPDAPDTCAAATGTSSVGSWIGERASGNGDVDWFRFVLTSTRRVVVTVGDVPVDGRLELYGSCSKLLATMDHTGTRFEELTRVLAPGTYRVRVSARGDGSSADPYVVGFRSLAAGLPIKSTTVTRAGTTVRIVGEVVNNSGSTRGPITVTATLRSGSGKTVATLRGVTFARRLAPGGVTSFAIAGTVPSYATISYAATAAAPGTSYGLTAGAVTSTAGAGGTVRETGTIRNTGKTTATGVTVVRTWYGRRGEILGRGEAALSPSRLVRGATGSYKVLRPALPAVESARTQARAR